eukprot:CAMPEP_0174854118 /NCGR_PEP_ID=MMETSP1114-20130205/30064_1 /TAXON_ID=312471 /ORGANISM="Neobodo designis, Strain CCAP 1951/1" /LENGTH=326 /DNA_ID=CAMNT_0016088791 /DNA_START=42 /DNA_END=1019 /DNA_ORIENTATION=+
MNRAGEAFRSNDFTTAEALYSAVIGMQPNNAKAFSNRSAVRMKLGEFASALKDAESCTRVDPGFAKGWGRHGAALQAMKHYDAARNAYQKALQLEPTNGSYKEALDELSKLVADGKGIATDDGREEYYFRRSVDSGVAAMKEGRYDEACRLFTKAMNQTSAAKAELHILLANRSAAHLKANRTLEAMDDAREAIQICPSYARGHCRLAAAALERQDMQTARSAIDRALEVDPDASVARELSKNISLRETERARAAENEASAAQSTRENVAKAVASSTKLDDAGPVSRETASTAGPPPGSRHTVSYAYCRVCSEYGHTARDCPLRKK